MSGKYKNSASVPSETLCARLYELALAVTEGRKGVEREFCMRIPAELDRDADLVISEAARRIERLETFIDETLGFGEGDRSRSY